jgi:hypothetical protein
MAKMRIAVRKAEPLRPSKAAYGRSWNYAA